MNEAENLIPIQLFGKCRGFRDNYAKAENAPQI
jgi:hypothetical protein